MIDLALIMACAPNVHPSTIQAIIRVESKGKPLALNINTKNGVKLKPTIVIDNVPKAVAVARAALHWGHSVDLGYMQINTANLPWLGYTIEDMFDPCKNIEAGARIFTKDYLAALAKYGNEQVALQVALSRYNTGNDRNGFSNGYVQRYFTK